MRSRCGGDGEFLKLRLTGQLMLSVQAVVLWLSVCRECIAWISHALCWMALKMMSSLVGTAQESDRSLPVPPKAKWSKVALRPLADINTIFKRNEKGEIGGRGD
ncbi:hypothetical protein ACLK19_10055 [Escherichia coli]